METETKTHPAQKIAKAILANQVALNANHDLLTSAPQMFRRNIKAAYKNYIHQLGKSESEYDLLFNQVEDKVCDTYDAVDLFFTTAAKIEIYDMQNAAAVLQAFLLDPKSMEGITNKILKHKTSHL